MSDGAAWTIELVPAWLRGGARVTCMLCGRPAVPGWEYTGCRECGEAGPLELVYPPIPCSGMALSEAAAWARNNLQPLALEALVHLGTVTTPLVSMPGLGQELYLKNEAFSPTGAHKDRYHAVAAACARLLRCAGVVTSSTGNHGVSAAAHAAAAGLPSVVLCHPDAPEGLLRTIHAFGGLAAQLPGEESRRALVELVERGWFPATSMDPLLSGRANPFGAEGYKGIAYETAEQLGRMPGAIIVPTAGGDTIYGIAKGFMEVAALTGLAMPTIIAVQPVCANSLSRSMATGHQVSVDGPPSIALSISDRVTGRQAMVALQRARGVSVDVSDTAIAEAVRDLARVGIYGEPASAASLAGYRQAVGSAIVDPGLPSVVLLTSSGFKWPETMSQIFHATPARSLDELHQRLTTA